MLGETIASFRNSDGKYKLFEKEMCFKSELNCPGTLTPIFLAVVERRVWSGFGVWPSHLQNSTWRTVLPRVCNLSDKWMMIQLTLKGKENAF